MSASSTRSNKAKIARRVIEVLDYFDEAHPQATVLDIVRRYDRPQSSTSELLATLVEMGLLHKDAANRTYRLTARAALMGSAGHNGAVSDGRLVRLIERLAAQTGLIAAVYTLNGINTQIAYWRNGGRTPGFPGAKLHCGAQEAAHKSAAGWLLLSTLSDQRCEGVLRRLNAEAGETEKFIVQEIADQTRAARDAGNTLGSAGFDTGAQMAAQILPVELCASPLVLGLTFGERDQVTPPMLRDFLRDAVHQELCDGNPPHAAVNLLQTAA